MRGSIPNIFAALPDLQWLVLNDNPGVPTRHVAPLTTYSLLCKLHAHVMIMNMRHEHK